jgi:hypothetical protein
MPRHSSDEAARILIETLRLGRFDKSVELDEIASRAKASESFTTRVLTSILGKIDDTQISLGSTFRVRIAIEAARAGWLRDAAQAISWQEFEEFAGQCLEEAGFRTESNVRVRGNGRMWQIDIIGFQGDLVLAIDCKHWNTPGSISRFRLAADHQRRATSHFLTSRSGKSVEGHEERHALAVILTLSEPPAQFAEGAVLVPVEKFPTFLNGVTPHDENLPFVTLPLSVVENPMSQSS